MAKCSYRVKIHNRFARGLVLIKAALIVVFVGFAYQYFVIARTTLTRSVGGSEKVGHKVCLQGFVIIVRIIISVLSCVSQITNNEINDCLHYRCSKVKLFVVYLNYLTIGY